MNDRADRIKLLKSLLDERILVLDGAMGTMIQQVDLTADDFGGAALEGCNENLVLTRPDVIRDIHKKYYEAGADIVETDTFGSTPLVLAEYGLADKCHEINVAAARIAREAAEEFSTPNKPRFVAASIGPTTKAITVTGGVTFDGLIDNFYKQVLGLGEGGADILLVETCQDTRNIKAALIGIQKAFDELGYQLPIMVSGTIEPMGTMLAGQAADALVASLQHVDLLSVGLNCATGPEFMTDHIRTMHNMANTRVSCYPNAGLPNEEGLYLETPTTLASALERFVKNGWLNFVGGCCGTTPPHIKAIAQMVEGKEPRKFRAQRKSWYSGIELVEATDDNRPLIVGERTNEVGSRAFKRLITEEKFEEATEIARAQVKSGAHIIDINLENTDRDELGDIDRFYEKVIHKVKVPFMIDTTNHKSIERALTYCLGKSIINSINFEDGEEKFDHVLPLVKKYGAAIVIGSIDEDKQQAQAITRERKLAIAQRARDYCVKHGIAEEDIIFDPLVFPCATGDENYIGSAVETVEGVRLIKAALPKCKTVLGVSNVSFGLPAAAREVINSVFLYHATKAGLDLAIVNAEKLERYATIPEQERKFVEDLLWNRPFEGYDAPADYRQQTMVQRIEINNHHIEAVNVHFRGAESRVKKKTSDLPLDGRLANYILEGSKEGLIPDLDLKLKEAKPLEIINGPLMDGMKEVGRLFNANELIVAEVLQSAEAMKAAVAHLEQFMEKKADSTKGKVLLATVKGDVHDIGKNLVEIILSNNGFNVINLGIKVPPEDLIKAYREHKPDAIGLSGLLVKSAQQMVITAGDLKNAGITVPLLVGGAALSDKFTRSRISPSYERVVVYCKDAMTGLSIMNRLMDPAERDKVMTEHKPVEVAAVVETVPEFPETTERSSRVRMLPPLPVPYPERKVRDVPQLREIWEYINPQMLYVRHLGFKSNFEKALAARDPKALELRDLVEELKSEALQFMKVKAVWQFFDAESRKKTIRIYEPQPSHPFDLEKEFKPKRQKKLQIKFKRARYQVKQIAMATVFDLFGTKPFKRSHLRWEIEQRMRELGLWYPEDDSPCKSNPSKSRGQGEVDWAVSELKYKGYLRSHSHGWLVFVDPPTLLQEKFQFPRQRKPDGLCLADYIGPTEVGKRDSLASFVVSAGAGIRERAEEYKARGDYLKSHAIQALAIETAEGCAEWLHRRIREDWGFPDPLEMTMMERFQARYQGKRYSFGYPACPRLEDQDILWKLLKPEEIGVHLTDGFMMDPEASVSALVFHHPDCTYFGVGDVGDAISD